MTINEWANKMKYSNFCNSRADNLRHDVRISPKIELDRDLKVKHILYKNHYDWRNKSARVVTRSNIAIFVIQGQIILEILVGFCP